MNHYNNEHDEGHGFSDEESTQKKRKVLNACDACRKKKIRCDGQENQVCSNCKSKNLSCSYTPTSAKRGPRQGYIETLEKRLELMEKLLQPLKNIELRNFQSFGSVNQSTPMLTNDRDSTLSPATRMLPSGATLSDNSPQIRDIESYILPDSSLLFPAIPSPPTPPVPVVTPEISEHLISLYFTYQHPLLPIIHRTTFIQSLQEGKQCALLLFTIYALASRFSSHPSVKRSPCYSAGEEYIAHAKILLESSSYSTPFLSTVQALVLMSLHEFGCDRYPTSWMYSGLAVRMGQHLNLYCIDKKDHASKLDWIEAETRRRTWFGCCLMDRIISTKTSWPMAIHDEDCQVKFPSDDYNWENSIAPISEVSSESYPLQVNSGLNCIPDHMYYFGNLISLMGQINQYTNRSTTTSTSNSMKSNVSPNDDEEQLKNLDQRLNEWSLNLPPHLHYNPQFLSSETPDHQMNSSATILLQSLFHTITIVLHRSNIGRYLNLMEPINDSHLSVIRCIQSANFIASMLPDLMRHRFAHYIPFLPYALYTAGTIHANRSFGNNVAQIESSRQSLEAIYNMLRELETYWGICKTYCTSLRGLYALRSQRDNVAQGNESINGNSNPSSCTVMSWLVPLKSSLHEWYPYLEKLAKDLDHNFCHKDTTSNDSTTPKTSISESLPQKSAEINPLNTHSSTSVNINQNFNPIESFLNQTTSHAPPNSISTQSNINQGCININPSFDSLGELNLDQLLSLPPNNLFSNTTNLNSTLDYNNTNNNHNNVSILDSNFLNNFPNLLANDFNSGLTGDISNGFMGLNMGPNANSNSNQSLGLREDLILNNNNNNNNFNHLNPFQSNNQQNQNQPTSTTFLNNNGFPPSS